MVIEQVADNRDLQTRINKAIKFINENSMIDSLDIEELLSILNGDDE